jgi:cell division protein FtsI/penicillin-binding protein 2
VEPSNLAVAAKTGTPAVNPDGAARHAWVAAYAPANKPRVVVVVFLERGIGGLDAAPIARAVLQRWR